MHILLDRSTKYKTLYEKPNKETEVSEYRLMAFGIRIGKKEWKTSFMVFLSFPGVSELENLFQQETFNIDLIDYGSSLVFNKKGDSYTVYLSPDPENSEIVKKQDIREFVISYWQIVEHVLGSDIVNNIINKQKKATEKWKSEQKSRGIERR